MTTIDRVAAVFVSHPFRVFSPAEIARAVPGVCWSTIKKSLDRLVARGDLFHEGYGRYRYKLTPLDVTCSCHNS